MSSDLNQMQNAEAEKMVNFGTERELIRRKEVVADGIPGLTRPDRERVIRAACRLVKM